MTSLSPQSVSEIHPELFHYTNEKGLFGILQCQCLRATHWQHLNDTQEIIHLRETLISLIKPDLLLHGNQRALDNQEFRSWLADTGGINEFTSTIASKITDSIYKLLVNDDDQNQIFDFFITSFSTPEGEYREVRENGLLSQWRAYGGSDRYAMVFDTAKLEALMKTEATQWSGRYTLGDVGYSSDSPEVLYQRLDALVRLKAAAVNFAVHGSEKTATDLLTPFLDCCTHFKHWAFSEEHEVRLVVTLDGPKMREQKVSDKTLSTERPRSNFDRGGSAVPCLNLFDGIQPTGLSRLPIRRIIVGPGANQDDRAAKLRDLLKQYKYAIPVTLSTIPLCI